MITKKWIVHILFLPIIWMGVLIMLPGAYAQQPIGKDVTPDKITEGHQFTEGPYWHPDGFLLYSDIPANTIFKWDPSDGSDEIFLKPSGHSNGITADMEGLILLAQHDGMVSTVQNNNKTEVLVDSYKGKRLNSPNDLVVRSDGTIYFTDPPFGVSDEERELEFSGLYRFTSGGKLLLEFDGFELPNGVALSPDESRLYLSNTEDGQIMVFDVMDDGSLENPQKFTRLEPGSPYGGYDGMVTDMEGLLYATSREGISVFNSDGDLIQKIEMPERVTNLEWGGKGNRQLFVTSPTGVYRLMTGVSGFKR